MVLFHHHQASAARILQHQIDRLQGNEPDQTLFSGIVMFLSSQIQQSAYGAWHAHLNGAKIMLDSWTPPGSELAIDKFLCFHLMVTDIYATATSPARQFSPTVAAQHCTYLDKMRHLNIDSSGLLTPIPNEIVLATIAINILRASRAASPMAHAHHEQGIEVSSAGLLASIQAFCPRSWSEKAFTNHATAAAYSVENPELSETLEGWRLMAQCFQAAAAMYLILSDVALEGNGFSEWDFARDSAYASLTVSIQRLFDLKQSGGKHHKFILWSIVIAGVEAAARGDRGVLEYLTFHLKVLTFDLGTMAMREAAYFLEHLWEDCARQRLDSAGYVRINWDRVFEARPVFLL